ncbi:uncharacterized protein EI90DRAFT_3065630 [Cantharellus anzutake]|uniref:uncharacterized protein n=1 Tax=Cantharellus anzutake TaxID=1750568 RepID=UPI001907625F|nr:uncharacterized protein EI90DRAFT_3065630 [Cantharellus anzutake]KAF8328109.1 hypothetical protein EI90DRAFT_3065630 [Cantharellus anzutake]
MHSGGLARNRLSTTPSEAELSLERLVKLHHQDEFLSEISRGFADRVTSADLQDPEIRDSRTNPRVLEHRIKKQKGYAKWYKLKYKQVVAKKEFLHLVLSDPERITHGDNEDFRKLNLQHRAQLESLKQTVEDVCLQLDRTSHAIKDREDAVKSGLELGRAISQRIKDAKLELARMRALNPNHKRLPISKVNEMLEAQDERLVLLHDEDSNVKAQVTNTKGSIALAMKELERLRPERARLEGSLAQHLREKAHQQSAVTNLCVWRRALIELYSKSIGLDEVTVASENELHLVYSSPLSYTLSIIFNPASQRLVSARILGLDIDISEMVEVAVDANDVVGLINNVRSQVAGTQSWDT